MTFRFKSKDEKDPGSSTLQKTRKRNNESEVLKYEEDKHMC